jgi:hypothetical protein
MTTLDSFVVLKKLTVSQLRVERRKVSARYKVETHNGGIAETELIYSYEQPYFDPSDGTDINLASMMVAQVAFNYGLFFETIEFDGLYDATDQRFIRDMTENTSREIITNKLLVKNEFLKPPFDQLQVTKQAQYASARIEFVNTAFGDKNIRPETTVTDFNKFAILSSGGKDSLLTYGLIREIGEAHPVFINESGRHWFTAVNAHRYFKQIEPNTEKPWCNSDRVFNWMLRQLPFIRENYASIRADIYPIRLWTVAVFLFGVLPVVRKRAIGNVLIGNEYDTTVTGTASGISHYNGLYDQSKYFDNALTRYFHKKGWQINQYSILRSLSELLIMRVLVKRYPELQSHQVSCHAAHEVNGRMFPCGNCEKCRRIIGMLRALDEDPARCGYTPEQITKGLHALEKQSVKQIGSDAAHLYYLLREKELVEVNDHTARLAKAHPEITKLRFDKERSNPEDLPKYIREPLLNILVKYADGLVLRESHGWTAITPDHAIIRDTPYKLEQK